MDDNTLGLKTNRVLLNIAQHPGVDPPEPGVAPVLIDGQPLHAVKFIRVTAGNDRLTQIELIFECEVGGVIGGVDIAQRIKESRGE